MDSNNKIVPIWIWEKSAILPEKLYNPPVVITNHFSQGIQFNVFREDKLIGGTKQRALAPLMMKTDNDTFVYAGPVTGYAQVAMAYCAFLTRKKAVVFISQQPTRTPLTKFVATFPAKYVQLKEIPNGYLKKIQAIATVYAKKTGSYELAVGGDSPDYIEELYNALKRSLPSLTPSRIWIVAGSATVLNVLYRIFPNTHFMVVQVGKTIWPDQIEEGRRTTLFVSPENFMDIAKKQPPYPTVATYDAKLWVFFLEHGQNGDYIWNVGADVP
jgi:hypothetical protein